MTAPEFQPHELARRIESLEAEFYELFQRFERTAGDALYQATSQDAAPTAPQTTPNGDAAPAQTTPAV